jgi:hypothetical protein
MRNKQPLLLHKLLAISLVAMLFIVQGIKLLHRHDYAASGKIHSPAGQHLAAAHYCAICDYHLAKDAELTPKATLLPALSYQYIIYPFRPSPFLAGMTQVHANKGPPAMML